MDPFTETSYLQTTIIPKPCDTPQPPCDESKPLRVPSNKLPNVVPHQPNSQGQCVEECKDGADHDNGQSRLTDNASIFNDSRKVIIAQSWRK